MPFIYIIIELDYLHVLTLSFNVHCFLLDLLQQIQKDFEQLYEIRKHELQKMKKTKPFYSLPGIRANNRWHQHHQMIRNMQPRSLVAVIEDTICSCINDVLVRFAWLLIIFIIHNITFKISEFWGIHFYCAYTLFFNFFLKKMTLKLFNFSILHLVRKCFGLNFNQQDILGYLVVYSALMLIFLYDSETWVQFIYNMVILGSLFTK